jgi:hypothetical protein
MAEAVRYTASILRDRADLRTRRPTRLQWQELSTLHHGRPVRSMGIVRDVQRVSGESAEPVVRVTVYDEEGGDEVQYEIRGALADPDRLPIESRLAHWNKGRKIIVEGILDWPDAEKTPVVRVESVRHS